MYSCSKSPKGSDSKIEDKIDNLIHKFPDQDSNIWGLALWHLWFHFPNFPVQQLRIAWHVHSEGRGRHRRHRPVVPAKCRHPCGSREQPMHCKCQGVATSRKKCSATSQAKLGQRTRNFHKFVHLATHQCCKDCWSWFSKAHSKQWGPPNLFECLKYDSSLFFGCYHRDKGDIGHEEVTNLGIRITMFKQGSLCYQPNFMHYYFREIPQNYHKICIVWFHPKWVAFHNQTWDFEDDFPFPKVRYVSSLEGNVIT